MSSEHTRNDFNESNYSGCILLHTSPSYTLFYRKTWDGHLATLVPLIKCSCIHLIQHTRGTYLLSLYNTSQLSLDFV
jgi:hypothetical protein